MEKYLFVKLVKLLLHVCLVIENMIIMYVLMKILFKNSIKMKFNEKITSNLFGSVRLLTEMVLIVIYSWFRF